MDRGEQTVLSLESQVKAAIDEARMVLPGIQALFGFQLIAVFNECRTWNNLERPLHLKPLTHEPPSAACCCSS